MPQLDQGFGLDRYREEFQDKTTDGSLIVVRGDDFEGTVEKGGGGEVTGMPSSDPV